MDATPSALPLAFRGLVEPDLSAIIGAEWVNDLPVVTPKLAGDDFLAWTLEEALRRGQGLVLAASRGDDGITRLSQFALDLEDAHLTHLCGAIDAFSLSELQRDVEIYCGKWGQATPYWMVLS